MPTPPWLHATASTLWRLIHAERLGRRAYVEINAVVGVLGFAVIFLPLLIAAFLPDVNLTPLLLVGTLLGILAAILMLVVFISTSMSRLADLGYSRRWVIAGLIPYLNIIFFLFLALTEGKRARELRTTKDS